jgi:hypothetical protein
VTAEELLALMRAYFAPKAPPEVLESFAEQSPQALLKESLDMVDFICYLEEELGREINVAQVGQALIGKNFGELSVAVAQMLEDEGQGA